MHSRALRTLPLVLAALFACRAPSAERPAAAKQGQSAEIPRGPVEARGAKRAFELDDFFATRSPGEPALSPDGTRVCFAIRHTDLHAQTSWSNLWTMDRDGSDLLQLTFGATSDSGPSYSPDGERILFARGGQLWTVPASGGEPAQLTRFAPGVSDPVWSPDGRYLAVTSEIFPECGIDERCNTRNAEGLEKGKLKVHYVEDELLYRHWTAWRDGKRAHVLLVDAESGNVIKDLTPGPFESPTFQLGGGRGYAFSPDGRELCFVSNRTGRDAETTNADLWVVPVDGPITASSAENLTDANEGWDGQPLYSPDGKFIAFVSQEKPGYESDLRRLALLERATKRVTYLTTLATFDDWVGDMRWRPDSRSLVFVADHRGRTPLFEIGIEGGKPKLLLAHAHINAFELVDGGNGVVYGRRSVGEPPELFSAAFGATPKRLTWLNAQLEAEVDIRPAEEFHVEGEAGYSIHGFLVKPHGFDPSKKYPVILNVHGGPQSQWTDAYRGDWQVYPGKGYVVAFCNPTGSTGYGQAFTDAITGDWGGRVFRDVMKVTDWLEAQPFVDAKRMGLMGWSYGGYMSMWVEGHTDRFAANAAMMGLFDLPSFHGATEELWFPEHDLRGTPWTSDDYVRWSPSQHVKNFKTPALVVSGELDYRVPYTQSLGYYTALRKQGVPARLAIFPDAGHWPAWHEMAFYYLVHLDFFHDYLGGGAAPYDVVPYARNLVFDAER